MLIEKENAQNEQYIFRHNNGCFSEVITYRKHLINKNQSRSECERKYGNSNIFF